MAQTYTIESVSDLEPTTWFDKAHNSTIYYIKVKISGHPKVVEIGKKAPDALKAGMTVYGDILPQDNPQFADKFKAVQQNPGYSGGSSGGKSTFVPKDEEAIARAVALKAAVEAAGHTKLEVTDEGIIDTAERFLIWLKARNDPQPGDNEPRYTDDDAQQAPSDIPF